jgi:hypothetical protein
VAHADQVLGRARQAVFGAEQDGQADPRRFPQQLRGVPKPGVDGRGVRDQADVQTAQRCEPLRAQDFQAGAYPVHR